MHIYKRPHFSLDPIASTIMASARYCPSCLSLASSSATSSLLRRTTGLSSPFIPAPINQQIRTAATSQNAAKYKRKDQSSSARKKKSRTSYLQPKLKDAIQFSLVDAMRYDSLHITTSRQAY